MEKSIDDGTNKNKTKTYISNRGYVIYKKYFDRFKLDEIRKDLKVVPSFCPGYQPEAPEPFIVYKENDKKIYMPRYYGIQKLGNPDINKLNDITEDEKEKQEIPEERLDTILKLRPIQEPIIKSYLESLDKTGGGTITAGCGIGKTAMAIYLITHLKVRTLILVHKEFLMNQWKDRISEFMPKAEIGTIQGPKCDVIGKDIVIGMVQSVSMKDDYPPYAFDNFGFLVVDEAHHMSSRCFSKALPKTSFKYTLGLSATPKRKDGLENVFLWYLGGIVYKSTKIKTADVVVKLYQYNNNSLSYCKEYLNYQKKPNNAKMISNIAECEKRNIFMGSLLEKLVKNNRKILILTERLSQVKWFLEVLKDKFIVNGKEIDVNKYVGGMKQTLLDISLKAQIIIGTYSMIEEGFDCPDLDTLIMATPKTNIEQSVGRILRKRPEDRDNYPLIIDIWDLFSIYKNRAYTRIRFYKENGYTIKKYCVEDTKDMKERTCKKMEVRESKCTDNEIKKSIQNQSNKDKSNNNNNNNNKEDKSVLLRFT